MIRQQLKEKFKTGAIPTGEDFAEFIDVGTSSLVIDAIRFDVPYKEYPDGLTEFYCDYKSSDYTDCLDEFPCLSMLKDGKVAVRTHVDHDNETAYQQIDNVKDGVFKASFVRVGNLDGTWSKLSTAYKPINGMTEVELFTKDGLLVGGTVSFDNGSTYNIKVTEVSD